MSGVGYGGDAGRDEQRRKKGTQAAQKRETKTWSLWQKELQVFCTTTKKSLKGNTARHSSSQQQQPPSKPLLDTLKQVLRCQAPDWWWKNPQRNLYLTALQVCAILTEQYPSQWGDIEDAESPIAALEELAQASKLLAKELDKENCGNKVNAKNSEGVLASTAATLSSWISSASSSHQDTNDKDAELPLKVMEMRDQALTAASAVLEKPELSMMGSQDYYRQVLRPLAFDTVEAFDKPKHYYDGKSARHHYHYGGYYNKKKKASAKNTKDNTNGVKASAAVLWKEISTYPNALPIEFGSSIFVRAMENQMDKLRVAIIGPDDTPYANGLFLFDVEMGHDYPNAPPRVQFLTTSNFLSASDKKVRFNPNLYKDGKVCLSLLGTWQGPGWQPGESTLLQVLVSIQSLILGVAEPYFNEPGYESSQGSAQGKQRSTQYNRNIRHYTLQAAILPFLQDQLQEYDNNDAEAEVLVADPKNNKSPTKRKGAPKKTTANNLHFDEFKDVVKQHFKLKHKVIQKQLYNWLQEDKTLEHLYSEYWNLWDKLEHHWNIQSAATGKMKSRRAKVNAPAVRMKDGVILLDDDDDDAADAKGASFEADTALAIKQSLSSEQTTSTAAAKKGGDDDEVIELADSDDEDEDDTKPAARETTTMAVNKSHGSNDDDVVVEDNENQNVEKAAASAGDVVDLT